MTEQEAIKLASEVYEQVNGHHPREALDAIRDALLSAHRVPEGCVRLPDGREVKVLGELPMTADGCVIAHNNIPVWHIDKTGQAMCLSYRHINEALAWYSTRAAAEAARREGEQE